MHNHKFTIGASQCCVELTLSSEVGWEVGRFDDDHPVELKPARAIWMDDCDHALSTGPSTPVPPLGDPPLFAE